MANAKNVKATTNTTTTTASMPIVNATNEQKTLTVVVLDNKSNPTEGARVSIKPSDDSSVTNSIGEVQFKLGSATKYDITASYGSKTVTVPYYVTKDGATRLVVNPTYVRSVEKKLHPFALDSGLISYIGIGLGIIILLFFVWKFFKRKKKNKKS